MNLEHFSAHLNARAPVGLRADLARYVLLGTRPGSFLVALLENDLQGTLRSGDGAALAYLGGLVQIVYSDFPFASHGDEMTVDLWVQLGGLVGGKISPDGVAPPPTAEEAEAFVAALAGGV